MSSDYGINKKRVDIKLNCKTSKVDTLEKVLTLIKEGATLIQTNLSTCSNACYSNDLYTGFKSIGIDDIRYGTMHRSLGGEGYTLYKK